MSATFERGRWVVEAHHQWDSFHPAPCNWRDFTFIHLGGEWSKMTGRIEAEITLLGLALRVVYIYTNTDFIAEMHARRQEMLARMAAEGDEQ